MTAAVLLGRVYPGALASAVLPGASITTKAGLIAACARALQFPHWAGRTWDALADCLQDLSWLPPGPRLLVWEHAEVLAGEDLGAFTVAVDILHGAVQRWAGTPTPLAVLLVGVDQTSVDAGAGL